jgi:hypothetical protein
MVAQEDEHLGTVRRGAPDAVRPDLVAVAAMNRGMGTPGAPGETFRVQPPNDTGQVSDQTSPYGAIDNIHPAWRARRVPHRREIERDSDSREGRTDQRPRHRSDNADSSATPDWFSGIQLLKVLTPQFIG